jgi:hypothetical protein
VGKERYLVGGFELCRGSRNRFRSVALLYGYDTLPAQSILELLNQIHSGE